MFYDIKHTNDYKTVGDNVQYKVFVDENEKAVVLQWEESCDNEDWLHNFLFFPWLLWLDGRPCLTTVGYAKAYHSCGDQPIDEFIAMVKHKGGYKTRIQGFSFGTAMTKIAVRHYAIRRKKALKGGENLPMLDEQITYGDVKIWYNPFLRFLAGKWVKLRREFCCMGDFVTWCVPFCSRTKPCYVGGWRNIFKTNYNHQHYEEYDYSKYEKKDLREV